MMPERRPNSVLVSLKELRNIETHRVEREEEEREIRERRARAAIEARERAAREVEELRRHEQERREREERERTERLQREERLRLAEAERRARVEAELSLERKRLEMQLGSHPRSRAPWLAVAGTTLLLGGVIALVGHRLRQESARSEALVDRIQQVRGDAAEARHRAEERIASLGGQIAELQGRLERAITAPKDEPPKPRPRPRPRPKKKPDPDPTLSTECIGSTDPLCGVLKEKEKKKKKR